jgi:hypothetical protein
MARGCLFCGHPKDRHYLTKQIRPDGTKGGPKTTSGCTQCVCRKWEPRKGPPAPNWAR